MKVTVVGASGYLGGEALRAVDDHPELALAAATSRRYEKRRVGHVHPTLRDLDVAFTSPDDLGGPDVVVFATPHGVAAERVPDLEASDVRILDLSADHRLDDADRYARWYGDEHPRPDRLPDWTYGLVERRRDDLDGADRIAGTGCIAAASILALGPLADADLVEPDRVVVDAKIGSSAAGREASPAGHHPERRGVVRPYATGGHRHEAEILQETGVPAGLTVHAIERVRGVAATVHAWPTRDVELRDLWQLYRDAYGDEPFVDLVRRRDGLHRLPEPKVVEGTNRVEVGFDVTPDGRVVAFSALDNLGKGGALGGIQALNVALGFDETAGIDRRGTHP